jgi:dolichyl-phosphate beta-glucosyltransferase
MNKFFKSFHALGSIAFQKEGGNRCLLSLILPARHAASVLTETVTRAHDYLERKFPKNFEIIIVPNFESTSSSDPTAQVAHDLARRFPPVRVVEEVNRLGKGAAVRRGFTISQGQWIFYSDSDLPFDLQWIALAVEKLETGFSLVSANRRSPTSRFRFQLPLMPLVYKRHQLGLLFNRFVRLFFPIQTRDTQAGFKAMSREFAQRAFSRQICPGFLFDLEIFLALLSGNDRHAEMPVTFYLHSEKTTVSLIREALIAIFWIIRLKLRYQKGRYAPGKNQAA